MKKIRKINADKTWSANCIWPEPLYDGYGSFWDEYLISVDTLDEEGEELLDIKEYFDSLVECGRLDENYNLVTGW